MADIHNAIKYETGVLNALAIATGLSRDSSGVERLSESLTPVLDIWSLPEWAILRSETLAGRGVFSPAAGVGTFSGAAMRNPAGSNLLIVIDKVLFSQVTVANEVAAAIDTETSIAAQFGTALTAFARDTRRAQQPRGLPSLGAPATTLTGSVVYRNVTPANAPSDPLLQGVVLLPGFGVIVQCQTANTAFYASFQWRERLALPGELKSS